MKKTLLIKQDINGKPLSKGKRYKHEGNFIRMITSDGFIWGAEYVIRNNKGDIIDEMWCKAYDDGKWFSNKPTKKEPNW